MLRVGGLLAIGLLAVGCDAGAPTGESSTGTLADAHAPTTRSSTAAPADPHAPTTRSPTGTLAVTALHSSWRDGSPVESGGANYPTDIYVVDVNGGRVRNLTRDERSEYSVSWLMDGRRILFASMPSDRMKPGPSHVFVVDADGSDRQRLTFEAGEFSPEPSPDGRLISFIARGARHRGLYVMSSDGKHKKRLTQSQESPYEASWSPDSRRIAFVRELGKIKDNWLSLPEGDGSDLFVINADGTGLRRLTQTKVDESEPVWSPDGTMIAFIREEDYEHLIYVVRSDGTGLKRLTSSDSGSPRWSSNDGVVYTTDDGWRSIPADGTGKPRPISRPAGDLGTPSPDGSWIAYSDAVHRIFVARTDGTHRRLVTRRICCVLYGIEWAPR